MSMPSIYKTLGTSVLMAGMAFGSAAALAADGPLRGNVRVVIGSTSTGGDTYQNSSIVADALAEHLDINMKVDAVGASSAFRFLDRDPRGNTLMIFHDQSYLGYLYGVEGYENIFEKYTIGPTVAINPGNAYLVPKDSPYQTLDDVIEAVGNGEEVRVAIQPGGVSEIGFSALKNAIAIEHPGMEENLVAVNTGSQADKNQQLFDDQADLINGTVQANEQYTRLPEDDQKAMRFLWLTARNSTIEQAPEDGLGQTTREQLLQYVEPNVNVTMGDDNFTFDKEFFFLYNKDMDQAIVDQIDQALAEIYAEGEIQETQKNAFFIPNFKPSDEAADYLESKMSVYEDIITNIQ
ncbi:MULTISPECIES: type 2 periplasmic-binding domain-containing protein [Chromohalobacter]|jgi:tripartite-type tricarboxylate transporter receptor subunit TctC|uniref:ABC transporter substrate-binding protein n=1 Tax=Chromohalobacter TaxID=42054 RepID=UPI000FFEE746|nr:MULTISPECIES: ABC transporter substrate-binding protein [Chromohalobacter]NQY46568.1 ABC transporter substrate-binding protein [Chromohalobacter sp.]NWO57526.1 ABC transporter substrate-binding protein [Chromohalobacter salexigens]RXE48904.1 ABC transporter substrate-binding protein [Chromohalobacter salexigens]